MVNNKILGLVGLSARAGKICFGADSTEENIIKRKAKLIIIATDSSDRTKKRFTELCEKYNVPVILYSNIDGLSKSIGKQNKAIVGVKEANIAKEIEKIYNRG